MALEVDAQVAARILTLEAEHKVKLSLLQTELKEEIELLKIENRNLQEKLQHETHLKEDLESVSSDPQQGSVFFRKACSLCAQGGPQDTLNYVWHCYWSVCTRCLRKEMQVGFPESFVKVWYPRAEPVWLLKEMVRHPHGS